MAKVILEPLGKPVEKVLESRDRDRNRENLTRLSAALREKRAEVRAGWGPKYEERVPQKGKLTKRLAFFTVDDPEIVLLGRETIFRNGEHVGWLTSGGFGYTVGKPIGFGYVRSEDGVNRAFLKAGQYDLEIAGELTPCAIHTKPLL